MYDDGKQVTCILIETEKSWINIYIVNSYWDTYHAHIKGGKKTIIQQAEAKWPKYFSTYTAKSKLASSTFNFFYSVKSYLEFLDNKIDQISNSIDIVELT